MLLPEIAIFNILRSYLDREGYTTLQLVSPGGQAPFGLGVIENGRKSTKYPDIITVRNDIIFVGEIKPSFSASDKVKLELIIDTASTQLIQLVSRYIDLNAEKTRVCPVLCHSKILHPIVPSFEQWIAEADGKISIRRA